MNPFTSLTGHALLLALLWLPFVLVAYFTEREPVRRHLPERRSPERPVPLPLGARGSAPAY